MNSEKIYKYLPVITGLLSFIVYLTTIAPSVIQIDSGELAAVQATLGIAHPTGYPLFTIWGYLFSILPLPFDIIFKLNLLAAIWCSLAAGIFTLTLQFIFENQGKFGIIHSQTPKKEKKKSKKQSVEVKQQIYADNKAPLSFSIIAVCLLGGLTLSFNKTFWFQSTSVEVYSLHIFLMSLIIYSLLRAFVSENYNKEFSPKNVWMIFAVFLALGFTNHMTTILVIPAAAYLFFTKHGFNKSAFVKAGKMLGVFFPVLILFYAYLPLRASADPFLNWGNPIDTERILRHISGKQYQVWIFSSVDAAKKQLDYFINNLSSEYTLLLGPALIGLFYSFRHAKKLFVFFLVSFIVTVLYSINYDISDIDAYFLLAYYSIAMFAAFGFRFLIDFLKTQNVKEYVTITALFIVLLVHIFITRPDVNQREVFVFEDYTKELLSSIPENAIVFSYQWDYFLAASYYYQFVEDYRRDVVVIDKELLRRSWYFHQLETCWPGIFDGMKPEMNAFLKSLVPFERDEPYDGGVIERYFRTMMTSIVSSNIDKRDFYVAPEVFEKEMQTGEFTLPPGYTIVPENFMFRVIKGNEYHPAELPDFRIRFPERGSVYSENIKKFIGGMLVRRALYEVQFGFKDRARDVIQRLGELIPGFEIPVSIMEQIEK